MKLILATMLVLLCLTVKAQTTLYKLKQNCVLKTTPSPLGDTLVHLYIGDEVTMEGYNQGYWKVQFHVVTGFLSDLYVTETPYLTQLKNKWIASQKQEAETVAAKPSAPTKKQLINKYGVRYGTDVFNGVVRMGMSKKMLTDILGKPDEVNRTVTAYSTHEQWVYNKENQKSELYYFDDGKLTGWQD